MKRTLIRREKVIVSIRYDYNLFRFNIIKLGKAMAIGYERSIYIISKNK